MTRRALIRHPATPCEGISQVEVEIAGELGGLRLIYRVTGRIGALLLPDPAPPARGDELWLHTCFEAFLRPAGGEAYSEFNVAPSCKWAAYRLDGYRAGRRNAHAAAPRIAVRRTGDCLEVDVGLNQPRGAARLGLAAVIEEAGGRISYWALNHPPGKPDFHHADCFALELPAALAP